MFEDSKLIEIGNLEIDLEGDGDGKDRENITIHIKREKDDG